MAQIKGEDVQRSDLACPVYQDAVKRQKVPKIPTPGGVCVVGVFIHHASGFFSVTLASLLLKAHED
jgi:hypothetical protein